MANRIINPAPPNLPLGPDNYERRYQDQHSNVLRLYFNQLKNALGELFGDRGGRFIDFPYGAFHQDGVTTLTSNMTNVSTSAIQVASTAGFPSSGYLLIGTELISYTTKTATTFDGTITRQVLGSTHAAHSIGDYVTEVQGTGSSTTIGTILFTATDYSNGVYASSDLSKIYFDISGVYNLQFSVQILNYTSAEDNVTVWFRKNGQDISTSASVAEVSPKHSTSPGATIMTVNLFVDVAAGDDVSLAWASETGDGVIGTASPKTSPVQPASPAVIFTVQFVSALPT